MYMQVRAENEESDDDVFGSSIEFLAEKKEMERRYDEFKARLEKLSANASGSVSRDHEPIIEVIVIAGLQAGDRVKLYLCFRPIFHCQTLKYNMKVRAGKGFSLKELKATGIAKKLTPTTGISVDHHRRNSSLEGFQTNVQRLKTYKAKLVIFSRRACKVKVVDSSLEELATATQVMGHFLLIVHKKPTIELVKVLEDMKSFRAYDKLR
ncbi:hypothetical protein ACS0TY_025010 [Phlomoides rotata]